MSSLDLSVFPEGARIGFSNFPHMGVVCWPEARNDGPSSIQSRAILRDGVHVVALDEATHMVYVINHLRHTALGRRIYVEIPGGGLDEGEAELDAAKRELLEETGVKAASESDWIRLFPPEGMCPMDGLVVTRQHAFLLLCGLKPAQLQAKESVAFSPLSELIRRDNEGAFHDFIPPYVLRRAFDWLSANRPDLLT